MSLVSRIRNLLPASIKKFLIKIIKTINTLFFSTSRFYSQHINSPYSEKSIAEYNKQRPMGPQKKLCYAPYTSMFFSIFGKISPCYATYYKMNSDYAGQRIMDIWQGEAFNEVRKQIENNDLSTICSFCNQPFVSGNYGSMLARKYDYYRYSKSKYPAIMEFELSNNCSLQCIMCNGFLSSSIRKNREKAPILTSAYDDDFIRQLDEFIPHLKVAEFTGGDPFLIESYFKIWEKIASINPSCQLLITTNANTFNNRIETLLNRLHNIHFNISIDSLKPDVYKSIRVGGDFEKAMKNVNLFIDYGKRNKTTVNIMVCPLRQNWSELPDFVDFCNRRSICVYFHYVKKPFQHSLWSLPFDELKTIVDFLKEKKFDTKTHNQKINNENFQNVVNLLTTWMYQAKDREAMGNLYIPSESLSQDEKIFIDSIIQFLIENAEGNTEQKEIRIKSVCKKVELMFQQLPQNLERNIFHSLPLDMSIIKTFEKTEMDELISLILVWADYNKPKMESK